MSKADLGLQCGMPCSKLEVSTAQHGTLSGAGYLHQSLVKDQGERRTASSPYGRFRSDRSPCRLFMANCGIH